VSGSRALAFRALVRACHPIPSAGVTAFVVVLAAAAGNASGRCAVIAAAILCGQLSVGWSNDRHDVAADRMARRREKPLAAQEVSLRVTEIAIACALLGTVGFSLALGWRAGLLHLAAVAIAWAYNFWLKGTWFSWLPYAIAFGSLPAVVSLALPGHPAPAAWPVVAAALLGVAANFTNALPDLESDRITGFRGAPNRLGARPSLAIGAMLLVLATAVTAFGPPGPPRWFDWAGLVATCCLVAVAVPVLWRRAATRIPFYALMAAVPIDLVMIGVGRHLH